MSTTPETAKYTECYVAFLDILGFSALVKESEEDPTILPVLVRALNEMADPDLSEHMCNGKPWRLQVRAFSDCVVLFIPTDSHAFTWFLSSIRYLHDRALELNCCLRGGMTIGRMYCNEAWMAPTGQMNEAASKEVVADVPGEERIIWERGASENAEIVLGPAHVEAYKLESEIAVYPRIIFSRKLMAHLRSQSEEDGADNCHDRTRASKSAFPLCFAHIRKVSDFIRVDFDGICHFDVFHRDIVRDATNRIVRKLEEDGRTVTRWIRDRRPYDEYLEDARKFIESRLQNESDVKCLTKYLWLANYFNTRHPVPIEIDQRW